MAPRVLSRISNLLIKPVLYFARQIGLRRNIQCRTMQYSKPELESQTQLVTAPTDQQLKTTVNRLLLIALFILCTGCYSAFTVLLHISPKDKITGDYMWYSGSMVAVTEVAKLLLSLTFLLGQITVSRTANAASAQLCHQLRARCPYRPRDLLPYAVPAALYAFNNNLGALLQLQMDAVSYQILSNMKILTTAVLFRIIMRKELSYAQWLSLLILFFAGVSNGAGGLTEKSQSSARLHVTPTGLVMMLIYCSVSGLASVYTEYVMKRQEAVSVHAQNSLLYIYGISINLLIFTYQSSEQNNVDSSLLQGFDWTTWTLVFSQAFGGISMGMLMKFGSNIIKLFVVSTSMLVITLFAMLVFDFVLNIYCIVAFLGVLLAQILYNYEDFVKCF